MQYENIITSAIIPTVVLTGALILVIFLSKSHLIFKLITLACVVYTNLLVFYPDTMKEALGNGREAIALACFTVAALAFLFSIIRFLKASVHIVCWLMIALVAGSVAFPDMTTIKFPEQSAMQNFINKQRFSQVLDHLKAGFSKSFE